MNTFEVKKSRKKNFYLIFWDASKTGIFFRTNRAKAMVALKIEFKEGKCIIYDFFNSNVFIRVQRNILHTFLNIWPLRGQIREGGSDWPPPTYELPQKSPLLVGLRHVCITNWKNVGKFLKNVTSLKKSFTEQKLTSESILKSYTYFVSLLGHNLWTDCNSLILLVQLRPHHYFFC